jgi:hypothetical protein
VFIDYNSEPIRPAEDAISVWLRAESEAVADFPFKVDFDNWALQRVRTGAPGAQ